MIHRLFNLQVRVGLFAFGKGRDNVVVPEKCVIHQDASRIFEVLPCEGLPLWKRFEDILRFWGK